MAYEIKPALWGFKPGKKETRQRVVTGVNQSSYSGSQITYPYATYSLKRQILDFTSQTFVTPSMQIRDFKPFAKELIDTGTVVLDVDKGKMFMWNLPPFSFELNQSIGWEGTNGGFLAYCGGEGASLQMKASGYSILLTPYLYISGLTRLSLNDNSDKRDLYLRLSYTAYKFRFYRDCIRLTTVIYAGSQMCDAPNVGGWVSLDEYGSLQQSVNYSDISITNSLNGMKLSQLFGISSQSQNGFYITGDGSRMTPWFSYMSAGTIRYDYYAFLGYDMFQEGTTSIRARVFLPELFTPVADQPAILTTSAPIISGCIVRFVKNKV